MLSLLRFFLRCAFHNIKIKDKMASADKIPAELFQEKFTKINEDGGNTWE